ncbi:MAG: hypothetical protein V1809_09935 [Planctomycetota bacterium]
MIFTRDQAKADPETDGREPERRLSGKASYARARWMERAGFAGLFVAGLSWLLDWRPYVGEDGTVWMKEAGKMGLFLACLFLMMARYEKAMAFLKERD